jgi:iron complex outermembrane recepter protein
LFQLFGLALCLAALPLLPLPTLAQSGGTVEGTITALDDKTAIEGVHVSVEGTRFGAITSSEGFFRITGVPAGQQTLILRRLGLEVRRHPVQIAEGAPLVVHLVMKESIQMLSDVLVSATRERERRVEVPMAIGVIDATELRATRPAHPSEIMNKVAGVWVNVTGGEGHMTAIRQPITTDPVYLYLEDGIPSRSTGFFNHNALYEINLPQADRIEVGKGPANALYGSDAIGGVVNVFTRPPAREREISLSAEGGGHGWARTLATMSDTRGAAGLRADFNFTRTDGWRRATDYVRQAGSVRWDQDLGSNARLKTLATFSLIDQQTAGSSVISRSDYENDPTINYTPISLRDVKAWRLSSNFEKQTSRSLFSVTPYGRYDWMRLLPNWSLTFDPQDYTTDNWSAGVLAKVRHDFVPLRTRLVVGTDFEWSPGRQYEYQLQNLQRSGPVFTGYTVGPLIYDYDVTYHGVSPYAQLETSPLARLRVTSGLRYDHSGYSYDTRLPALDTGRWRRPADTSVSYDHVSPKVGATYEFHPAINAYASYRHGFRAPSQGQLFRQGSSLNTVSLEPVKADELEGGLRGAFGHWVEYDATGYDLEKSDDILTYTRTDGSTEIQNAGRTKHCGIETSLGASLPRSMRLDVGWSYARHTLGTWRPSASQDLTGKEMVSAPRHLGNVSFTYAPKSPSGLRGSLQWEFVGRYWMDQTNTHRYPSHHLVHLRASAPVGHRVVASLRVLNLTNERYAETAQYTTARGEEFAPGVPRTLYGGLQYDLR